MAEGGGGAAAGAPGTEPRGLFKAWKAMNAWGDELERKHFNGDFLATVGTAPRKTAQAMNEWGDDFERRHFDGDLVGALDRTLSGAAFDAALAAEGLQIDPALASAWVDLAGGAPLEPAAAAPAGSPSSGSGDARQSAASSSSSRPQPEVLTQQSHSAVDLWEEAQGLQRRLAEHRGLRQERSARRRDADVELHPLRAALIQERAALLSDRGVREAAGERRSCAQHEADVLRAQHHLSLGRQARLEAEAQYHTSEERRAEQAEEDWTKDEGCGGDREWARDGPETDALKDAKLALAEVLGDVDEVRMLVRRELYALQEAVAAEDKENAPLRRSEEEFVPEKTIFSSVKLLFNIARGRGGAAG